MKYLAMRLCVSLDSFSTELGKGHQEMMSCEEVQGSKHTTLLFFPFSVIGSMILLLFC